MNEIHLANDANAVLNNHAFKLAKTALEKHLESKLLTTDPNDGVACTKVVQAKQILKGLIRELEMLVENGQVEQIRLDEIESKSKVKLFRR